MKSSSAGDELGLSIKKNCRIKKDCEPLLSLTD
jgi:hypothetical protein